MLLSPVSPISERAFSSIMGRSRCRVLLPPGGRLDTFNQTAGVESLRMRKDLVEDSAATSGPHVLRVACSSPSLGKLGWSRCGESRAVT